MVFSYQNSGSAILSGSSICADVQMNTDIPTQMRVLISRKNLKIALWNFVLKEIVFFFCFVGSVFGHTNVGGRHCTKAPRCCDSNAFGYITKKKNKLGTKIENQIKIQLEKGLKNM